MATNYFLERYASWGFPQSPTIKSRTTLRINTLKISSSQFNQEFGKKIKLEKVPYLRDGYFATANFSLVSSPQYLQGFFYIQEAASQLPAQILNPKPTDAVADLCCAPGSKTTQLAQLMHNNGTLYSVDSNSIRLQKVQNNLERCGVTNCILIRKDVLYLSDIRVQFDKILLDAPCSGNFVIDEDWFDKRSISGVQENARLQKQLIIAAFDCLKSGGEMIYSTCSLEIEENEQVVEHLLAQRPGAKIIPINPKEVKIGDHGLTDAAKHTLRLWPSSTGTQGFYIAHISKQ